MMRGQGLDPELLANFADVLFRVPGVTRTWKPYGHLFEASHRGLGIAVGSQRRTFTKQGINRRRGTQRLLSRIRISRRLACGAGVELKPPTLRTHVNIKSVAV